MNCMMQVLPGRCVYMYAIVDRECSHRRRIIVVYSQARLLLQLLLLLMLLLLLPAKSLMTTYAPEWH